MSYTDHSAQRLFKSNTPIHFICDRVCKHRESITTGSRKSPTSRLHFQFRPWLQAATRYMKSNTPSISVEHTNYTNCVGGT